jgi:subfamily B ATP-binding cassette protein MsbA
MTKWKKLWPLYRRLLAYAKPYRGRLIAGLFFGALYGPFNWMVLSVVQKVWARLFEQDRGEVSLWMAAGAAALLPLAIFGRGVCDFLTTYLMNWVGLRAVMDIRVNVFAQLQRLSHDYFSGTKTGELISRVTNDIGLVQNALSNVIEEIIKEPIAFLAVLGWLFYKDWQLTTVAIVMFPVCLIPILAFGRRTRRSSRSAQEHTAVLVTLLHEALVGMRVVKAFGMEAREVEDFADRCRHVFRQRMSVIRARSLSSPIIESLAAAGGALVCIYAFYRGMPGSLVVPFGLGLFMLYGPVKKLSRAHMQVQESLAAAERIFQILDEKPSVKESPQATALPRFQKTITFDHVTFRYDNTTEPVLSEVHLEIPRGTLTAVVGASGAGKTTLFNLVPRFYDPTSGAVRIDGVDIRDVTFKSLREQIGLVTQETFLFNDTVANNIAYGKPTANRDEIISAARRAHAHEFIMKMPEGYDTMVGDLGVKLSGGQRQRLAIARAVLRDPPILLLDEATSALDTESERLVQAALDDLMWGEQHALHHTMLVIAHRLSTVRHADRIIVLEKGRIVEEGTHEELLARGQTYKRLHDLQFTT